MGVGTVVYLALKGWHGQHIWTIYSTWTSVAVYSQGICWLESCSFMVKYLLYYYSCKKLPVYISLGIIHLSFLKENGQKYSSVKLAYDCILLNNPECSWI